MKRIVDDHNILINDKSKTITVEESEVLDSLKTSGKANQFFFFETVRIDLNLLGCTRGALTPLGSGPLNGGI